mmetsp:Transcript_37241/g.100721  ORF Transcript_37241/g.100721 Transcript_37241/m.100721 type:complete len:1496 (-) Transcript_37241:574-5061(-)
MATHRHRHRRPDVALLRTALVIAAILVGVDGAQQLPTDLDASSTTSIAFNGLAYTGTIPTEFGLLTGVTSFEAQENSITGSIPSEIGLMAAVKATFKVQKNSLSGTIPTEFGGMTELVGGALFTNFLTGHLPTEMGRMTEIKSWFQGFSNLFSGPIPTEMGEYTKMVNGFKWQDAGFSKAIPTELGRFTKITKNFMIGSNKWCGDVPTEVQALSDGVTANWQVTTSSNSIGTTCSDWPLLPTYDNYSTVKSISVNQLDHTGTIPTEYGLLTECTEFNLGRNSLTGTIPSQLGLMTKVTTGGDWGLLQDNSLSSTVPTELGQLTNIVASFYLYANNLCDEIPTEVEALSEVVQYGWEITTGNYLGTVCSWPKLPTSLPAAYTTAVYHNDEDFTGSIPTGERFGISPLDQLIRWSVGPLIRCSIDPFNHRAKASPRTPKHAEFGLLTEVTDLNLGRNSFTSTIPTELANMVKLQSGGEAGAYGLVMWNSLTGNIPTELGAGWSNFTSEFDLNSNKLTGPIPTELGLMSKLDAYFFVHTNSLTSAIPTELGQLVKLSREFDLYSNDLTSVIPTQLGLLVNMLTSFDLQYNEICDDLPTEIAALSESMATGFSVQSNHIGTTCDEMDLRVPTPTPSVAPTFVPTITCADGEYLEDDGTCIECVAGKYANNTAAPYACELCPVGKYYTGKGATECNDCASGKLSGADRTYCDDCPSGTFADTANQSCVDCPLATYASIALDDGCTECVAGSSTGVMGGGTSCTKCDSGKYSEANRTSSCSVCPSGTFSGAGAEDCTECVEGFFQSKKGSSSCESCKNIYGNAYDSPAGSANCSTCVMGYFRHGSDCTPCDKFGMDCTASGKTVYNVSVRPGYFKFSEMSPYVYRCANTNVNGKIDGASNCLGGSAAGEASCKEGSAGVLCTTCSEGYWLRSDGTCRSCAGNSYFWPVTVFVMFLVVCLLALRYNDQIHSMYEKYMPQGIKDFFSAVDDAGVVAEGSKLGFVKQIGRSRTASSQPTTSTGGGSGVSVTVSDDASGGNGSDPGEDTFDPVAVKRPIQSRYGGGGAPPDGTGMDEAADVDEIKFGLDSGRQSTVLGSNPAARAAASAFASVGTRGDRAAFAPTALAGPASLSRSASAPNSSFLRTLRRPGVGRAVQRARQKVREERAVSDARSFARKLKIMFTFSQLVSNLGEVLDINFPIEAQDLFDWLQWVNVDLFDQFKIECMNYNTNFFDELLFATLAPIALALLLAIGDVVYTWRQRNPDFQFCPRWCDPSNARSPPAIKRMTGQLSKGSKLVASVGRGITVATGSSHAPFISAGILLTYLVLPAVSSKIMNTFRCSEYEVDDEITGTVSYLTVDHQFVCSANAFNFDGGGKRYNILKLYAIIMTLVYPVGIPLLYAVLLYSSRKELALPELLAEDTPTHAWFIGESVWPPAKLSLHKRQTLEAKKAAKEWDEISGSHHLSFLLEAYDRRVYWFEVVEVLRRLALSGFLVLCGPGSAL